LSIAAFDLAGLLFEEAPDGSYRLIAIERSRFFDTQVAHHIKSRASRPEFIDHIENGSNGTGSLEVDFPMAARW
jgi:hypothetical protein